MGTYKHANYFQFFISKQKTCHNKHLDRKSYCFIRQHFGGMTASCSCTELLERLELFVQYMHRYNYIVLLSNSVLHQINPVPLFSMSANAHYTFSLGVYLSSAWFQIHQSGKFPLGHLNKTYCLRLKENTLLPSCFLLHMFPYQPIPQPPRMLRTP